MKTKYQSLSKTDTPQLYFTAQEIEDLGFHYNGLTKEDEFHYEFWHKEICGVWFEVTNEYETNGTFKKQFMEINNYFFHSQINKEQFLELIKILEDVQKPMEEPSKTDTGAI